MIKLLADFRINNITVEIVSSIRPVYTVYDLFNHSHESNNLYNEMQV